MPNHAKCGPEVSGVHGSETAATPAPSTETSPEMQAPLSMEAKPPCLLPVEYELRFGLLLSVDRMRGI